MKSIFKPLVLFSIALLFFLPISSLLPHSKLSPNLVAYSNNKHLSIVSQFLWEWLGWGGSGQGVISPLKV